MLCKVYNYFIHTCTVVLDFRKHGTWQQTIKKEVMGHVNTLQSVPHSHMIAI